VHIHDLRVGEMFFQRGEVGVIHVMRRLGQFFHIAQGDLFLLSETSAVAFLQRLPVLGRQAGSLRRSEMVLGSIVALVKERNAQIDHLVQLAIERAADAGVEGQEVLQHIGTVRQRLLHVAGLAL
jgi:hypothetical protein